MRTWKHAAMIAMVDDMITFNVRSSPRHPERDSIRIRSRSSKREGDVQVHFQVMRCSLNGIKQLLAVYSVVGDQGARVHGVHTEAFDESWQQPATEKFLLWLS